MSPTSLLAGARLCAALCLALLVSLSAGGRALAVPAFAAQTGQPCQQCHVGGYGPQLTPYGRNFKIGGYTQRANLSVPVSMMAVASYVRTQEDQAQPPAAHFSRNDNASLDEFAMFLAGGAGQHFGGFAEVTYSGVDRKWTWDNLDLRAVTKLQLAGRDVVLGASLNNSPTVQDPWNTLPAWGFPFTASDLSPSPAAAPILAGALAQNTLGLTGYAWIDGAIYLEAGGYRSPSARTLRRLGADPDDPGDIDGLAPYGRLAYQRLVGAGTLEVGAVAFRARLHPGRDRDTGLTDRYTDLGLDASYQTPIGEHDTLSVEGRYLHEAQRLDASCALAGAGPGDPCARNTLSEVRGEVSYSWRGRIGATAALFDTFGSANPFIYSADRTFRPDSSGLMLQVDATPFGDRPQPQRRVNVRVGAQYTAYARFNGARSDFDGAGSSASGQNTFRIFAWFAF